MNSRDSENVEIKKERSKGERSRKEDKEKKKWRKEKKTEIDPALRELDSGERGHALDSNCTF